MMSAVPEDQLPITELQRSRLLDFVERVDRSIGDSTFDRSETPTDVQLVILAIMCAQLSGVQDTELSQFFASELGLPDIDQDAFARLLSIVMLTSVEQRIRCAAGGRN
jgi:hypothetical protein